MKESNTDATALICLGLTRSVLLGVPLQIGNRPGHREEPVVAPGAQVQPFRRPPKDGGGPAGLTPPGRQDPHQHRRGGFTSRNRN